MSNVTVSVKCPRCNGVTSGTLLDDDKVCGGVPPYDAPEHAPRTTCRGMSDFKYRVADLLQKIDDATRVAGYCDVCQSPVNDLDEVHAPDCSLVAMLREAIA